MGTESVTDDVDAGADVEVEVEVDVDNDTTDGGAVDVDDGEDEVVEA